MYIYLNMDRKLLRNGGRKAPEMTLEQFETLFDVAVPHLSPDDGCRDDMFDVRLLELVENDWNPLFKKVQEDFSKFEVDFENFGFSGFRMGSNGVPFAECYFYADWEQYGLGMIYWDGKAFRGYFPSYGNTFNIKTKEAFGGETFHSGPYTYSENDELKTVFFKTVEEYEKFCWETYVDSVRPCASACNEDFSLRVVSTGKMTNEEFEKTIKKVSK